MHTGDLGVVQFMEGNVLYDLFLKARGTVGNPNSAMSDINLWIGMASRALRGREAFLWHDAEHVQTPREGPTLGGESGGVTTPIASAILHFVYAMPPRTITSDYDYSAYNSYTYTT